MAATMEKGRDVAAHSNKNNDKLPNIVSSASKPPRHSGPYAASHHIRKIVACALVAVLMFVGTAAALVWVNLDSAIQDGKLNFLPQNGESEEILDPNAGKPITFLLIGQDTRDGNNKALSGGTADEEGIHNSDTAMVVQISARRDYVNIVSIPRDSLVDVPSCHTSKGTIPAQYGVMFNSVFSTAYREGGNLASAASCTVNAVNSLTGLHIHNFVVVDFQGLFDMIDAIGGVDVCVPVDTKDTYTELDLKKGWRHLDGLQATEYARMRHGTGTDGSDIMRTTRQQYLIKSLFKEVTKKNLLTQSNELYQLAMTAIRSLNFSSGMARTSSLIGLAWSLRDLQIDHIYSQTIPVVAAPYNPNRVVWAEPAADDVWKKFRNDEPLFGTVQKDDSKSDDSNNSTSSPSPSDTPSTGDTPDATDAPDLSDDGSPSAEPSPTGTLDQVSGLLIMPDGTMVDPDTNGIVDPETAAIRDPETNQYVGLANKYLDNVICGVPTEGKTESKQ